MEPGARLPHRSAAALAQLCRRGGPGHQPPGLRDSSVSVSPGPGCLCAGPTPRHLPPPGLSWALAALPRRPVRRDSAQHRPTHAADRGPRARLPGGSAGGELEVEEEPSHLCAPAPSGPCSARTGGDGDRWGQAGQAEHRHNHAQSLPGSSQHGLHMFRTRPAGTACRQNRALRSRSRCQAHTAREGSRASRPLWTLVTCCRVGATAPGG